MKDTLLDFACLTGLVAAIALSGSWLLVAGLVGGLMMNLEGEESL